MSESPAMRPESPARRPESPTIWPESLRSESPATWPESLWSESPATWLESLRPESLRSESLAMQPESPATQPIIMSQLSTPFKSEEPSEMSQASTATKTKRLHYTPELKLQLICLCINNSERYLQEALESAFWQYITASFKQITGHQEVDLWKKVSLLVSERKAEIDARKKSSGVALPPATDLEQAIDSWIEICERRAEVREAIKSEASTEVKKEKAIAEVLRNNLSKRLSKKRDFQAVVEGRETVDLTAPGDVVHKRRQIRANLRTTARSSRDECRESMRDDLHKLTEVMINYMSNTIPPSLPTPPSTSAPPPASTLPAFTPPPPAFAPPPVSTPIPTLALATSNSEIAELKAEVASFNDLKKEVASIKDLLLQLIREKSESPVI